MQRKLRNVAALVIMNIATVAFAAVADITGNWAADIDTPVGQMKWTYTFKTDGKTLSGTASANGGPDVKLQKCTIEGDTVTFLENADIGDITYSGTILSADEIQFHRKVSTIAEEDFVAKRVKKEQ